MLGCAPKLATGLEASIALGTHHPGLSAAAVFFQHSGECVAVAAALAFRFVQVSHDYMRAAGGNNIFTGPNSSGAKFAAPVHAGADTGFARVAGAGEGFAGGGRLADGIRWQHGGMARHQDETPPGWNLGKNLKLICRAKA